MAGSPFVRAMAAAAGLAATSSWAQDNTRPQLEKMERALAEAAGRVSRPAAVPILGAGEICRGYRLQGVGAWFVVAPRVLPEKSSPRPAQDADIVKTDDELARAISNLDQGVQAARSEGERRTLKAQREALVHRRRDLRARAHAAVERERELRAWQELAEAMHRAAAEARQDARRSIQLLERMRESRIEVEGEAAVSGPGSTVSEQDRPAAPRSSHAVPPILPFKMWAEAEPVEEARAPEAVMRDVREAILQALAEHGAALPLPANEMLAVAVDFFRPAPLACSKPPARTLVIRAPGRVLTALANGSLKAKDARKQFETLEY